MNYTKISPFGTRVGFGTFETIWDSEKYNSIEKATAEFDYVVIDFVRGDDDLIYFEAYHCREPEVKERLRLNYQHFPFGVDALDDSLAIELGMKMFIADKS